jgi:hypothetical protein
MIESGQVSAVITEYYAIDAEGHRIGLCCCRGCGAVLLIGDPGFDSVTVHLAWHEKLRRDRGNSNV